MHDHRRRRAGRLLGRALLALITTIWLAAPIAASVVVPLTLEQLTREAMTIVDGVVAEVRAVAGPAGAERLVLVRVASTWKGAAQETLYVRLPGGRLGRTETVVAGAPVVDAGERAVWFLAAHPRGGHVVLGLHQGVFRTQARTDGAMVVFAPPREAGSRGDLRRLPRRLEDVAADVRALLTDEDAQ